MADAKIAVSFETVSAQISIFGPRLPRRRLNRAF
jgi:hypothetical protein